MCAKNPDIRWGQEVTLPIFNFLNEIQVIVISQCECDILVIAQVQGGA